MCRKTSGQRGRHVAISNPSGYFHLSSTSRSDRSGAAQSHQEIDPSSILCRVYRLPAVPLAEPRGIGSEWTRNPVSTQAGTPVSREYLAIASTRRQLGSFATGAVKTDRDPVATANRPESPRLAPPASRPIEDRNS